MVELGHLFGASDSRRDDHVVNLAKTFCGCQMNWVIVTLGRLNAAMKAKQKRERGTGFFWGG